MFAWKRTGRNSLGGSSRRSRRAESDRLQYLAGRINDAKRLHGFLSLPKNLWRLARRLSDEPRVFGRLAKAGALERLRAEWVSIADIKCERSADETAFAPLFLSASVRYKECCQKKEAAPKSGLSLG